jgi:anti-sigma B factor antagonist
VEQAKLEIHHLGQPTGDHSLIEVCGELDVTTAARLREALTALPPDRRVTLELSGLTFCDSSGLNALLVAHRHFAPPGELVLKDPAARLRAMLELTGLNQILTIAGP